MTSMVTGLKPKIHPARIFSPAFRRSLVLRAVKSEHSLQVWEDRRGPPAKTNGSVDHRLALVDAALLDLGAKVLGFLQAFDRTDIDPIERVRVGDAELSDLEAVGIEQRRDLPLHAAIAVECGARAVVGALVAAEPDMNDALAGAQRIRLGETLHQ